MSTALAPAFLVASLLLCVAGLGKLRAPAGAAAALQVGLWLVRVLAAGEVALGAACVLHPTRGLALALAVVFGLFATVAVIYKRRRVACGCFGDDDLPVSQAHVIASELLGTLALASAVVGPRGLGWALGLAAPQAVVLLAGVAGAVYAVVLVYTVVPRAWGAWERA
jgi:hypothetical protein